MAQAIVAKQRAREPSEYERRGIIMPRPAFVNNSLKRASFVRRNSALRAEIGPFLDEWRQILEVVRPRRGKFMMTDRQQTRLHGKIINNTATISSRTLQAGMMSGISSPARPWMRLTTQDKQLGEYASVKTHLNTVARLMGTVFAQSNTYNSLHTIYGDLGDIGNGSMIIDQDFEDVIRTTLLPPGTFKWALGARGVVDTIYYEYTKTVKQLIEEHGPENCSPRVNNLYDQGNYDQVIWCVHVVEPNMDQIVGELGLRGHPFICVKFERDGPEHDKLLEVKGYHEWPAPSPRWDVQSGDTFGSGPGLDVNGDVRALQRLERRGAQSVDKLVTPPTQAPVAARRSMNHFPGGSTFFDSTGPQNVIRPIYEQSGPGIQAIDAKIAQHERRINTGYFADLFLMLAQSDRREITAREIDERHEEKLLALGPVLERLHDELLSPLVNRTYAIMDRVGMLPPPPPELNGVPIKIEYISLLAQAQRAVSVGGIEKFFGFIGNLSAAKPDVLDKVDFDQAVDVYADSIGIDPSIVVPDDKVMANRAARAKQQATAQAMEAAKSGADTAQVLANTDMGGDTALSRILDTGGFAGGGATP